ncbi:GNAT family N-acetyltransferase [Pararhodobacter sp.]|uniref:GNAT family N-acetyltransferase n=1 Tax=Pararhodobacter sp. TaxID=2127056 RepID=UPI002B0038A8|nr:GNAT family N-acetyltransferase [Pararhodobacter sp.]
MSPEDLALLHAAAFTAPPPWSAASFAGLLASPAVFLVADPRGRAFALGRVVAGEAELLTLATDPGARRQGLARASLAEFDRAARERGALSAFLEVAEDNAAARALYVACGWTQQGRRPGYYVAPGGERIAALILCKSLA